MRQLLIASLALVTISSGAFAADLSTPVAPVASSPAPINWTGFYAGVFGGLAASTDALDLTAPGGGGAIDLNVTGNGWLGGGRIGYDYDLGGPVLGAYADFAGASIGAQIDGSLDLGGGATANFDIHDKLQRLGTVQVKAGEAFGDLLAYVHGGFAYGHTEAAYSISGGGAGATGSTDQDRTGWTIGAGLAYQMPNNIEINTEYGYYDLGTASVANIGGVPIDDHLTFNTATVGLSYKF